MDHGTNRPGLAPQRDSEATKRGMQHDRGGDSGVSLADEAREIGRDVHEQSRRAAGAVRNRVSDAVDSGRDETAERMDHAARALHKTADSLREEDDDLVARIADRAADQLDSASDYLRRHGVRDILRDVEDFARRRPEVFLVGAAVIGLAAARFLKSSARRADHDDDDASPHGGMGVRSAPGMSAPGVGPRTPVGPMSRQPGAGAGPQFDDDSRDAAPATPSYRTPPPQGPLPPT